MQNDDVFWMEQALQAAKSAMEHNEVPVGALLLYNNELIAINHNRPIMNNSPIAHAEILVLIEACEKLNNYRLPDTTLYVTLEPCPMCVGAMLHARIKRVVFGAFDIKSGACGSVLNLASHPILNHTLEVTGGILAEESKLLLQTFFKQRR